MEKYNEAEYIELTIKCLYRDRNVLSKAKDLQVTPEDFGTLSIYNAFVAAALKIGTGPINPQVCLLEVKPELQNRGVGESSMEQVLAFWEFLYDDSAPLSADYILKNFPDFISFRRFQTLRLEKTNDPRALVSAASKLVNDIDLRDSAENIKAYSPIEELVFVEHRATMGTGFGAVDGEKHAQGLGYQEYGIILGHSGSGKTAMGTYSAIYNARQKRKVLYLSLEEPAVNICNRVYSNLYRIPYTDLHRGNTFAQQDLRNAHANMNCDDKIAMSHLRIHDLRDAAPITAQYIANYLDQLYEKEGWYPDLVYIDQMDYLTTSDKFDADWQRYSKVAFEVDDLSNHLIGGKHMFSVWLLHQAGGKMKRSFSNDEISGFKGILRPADMVLAIGRDSPQDSVVSIFSIKSRHAKNFRFDYLAELEFMNFEYKGMGDEDRSKEEDKDKKKKMGKGNFENILPKKAGLLPAAGTGFHSSV